MNLQERIDMWTDKVNFTNSRKKGVVAILAGFALLGGTPVPAQASSVQNTNIHKEYTHSRPLITGSIRGSALVLPRNHNNGAVRARVWITNRTSDNRLISSTFSGWRNNIATAGQAVTTGVNTGTIIGGSRWGTVLTEGERRAISSNTWNGTLTRSRTW